MLTIKLPASAADVGLVPPGLRVNENAPPPLEKVPVDPKG